MKLLILRSTPAPAPAGVDPEYLDTFNTRYAGRVIGNLRGHRGFCSACDTDCTFCRRPYRRQFDENQAAVIDLPGILPHLLEDPGQQVPADLPRHDILLAICIHEQLLLHVLEHAPELGTRGVVVPLEAPGWISGSARERARETCEKHGVEIAFPKPFCAFEPPDDSVLGAFRQEFHIGMPDVDLTVENGVIVGTRVNVSAACGATYYIARWLEGRRTDEELLISVVGKRLHTYPCTASMEWDDEIDHTFLHVAGNAHDRILAPIADITPRDEATVQSPIGRRVQKAIPPQENLANIEAAKRLILEQLEARGEVTFDELRQGGSVPPAALSSAVILLKQDRRIAVDGPAIRRRS